MYGFGYSLNNLSLMGLTIAVGFVVDDGIVVIENVMRHVEEGRSPLSAAIEGCREVTFTIVSMTVSLIAVFIPILAMGGIVGKIFREFAVTISVALIMSAIVSLTVTPMLCGWLLRPDMPGETGRIGARLEQGFARITATYGRALDWALCHQHAMMGCFLATIVVTVGLYAGMPKGFFPQVDTSFVLGTVRGRPDISFKAMSERVNAVAKVAMDDPDVATVDYWVGPNPTMSDARIILNLKPLDQRESSADEIIARVSKTAAEHYGVTQSLQVRQDIQIGARVGMAQYQYTLQAGDVEQLYKWSTALETRLKTLDALRDVSSDRQQAATSLLLDIDRNMASRLGVTVQDIDNTLYDAFGQRQIATVFAPASQYYVVQEVASEFQLDERALQNLFVRSALSGRLVSLSLLVKLRKGISPVTIAHQGVSPAVTLSFNVADGFALSDAVEAIESAKHKVGMPDEVTGSFQGTARAFQASLKSQPWLIAAAILAIYIVLGVLYESAIHPLTIISTLPSAGLGALLALGLTGNDLSIMGIIGILLLIGIVKKNAIMMIDFALQAQRGRGAAAHDAIREACLLRFRPILMTTLAALLGAIPLAVGSGAGAELRQPLGIAIVGGLIVSQLLTMFTTPVIFLWFAKMGQIRFMPSRYSERVISD
jgi:multidrug efflux pump subunit AcrB